MAYVMLYQLQEPRVCIVIVFFYYLSRHAERQGLPDA